MFQSYGWLQWDSDLCSNHIKYRRVTQEAKGNRL